MRKPAPVVLTVLLATAMAACAEPAQTPPAESAPPTAGLDVHQAVALTPQQEAGKVTFESVCWTCHGAGGHGDGPARTEGQKPPTFHTRDYSLASAGTLIQRFQAAVAGNDPAHPHMQHVIKLVEEDAFRDAVAYIPALAYPPEIPGSALHGQQIYQYRCSGCHGTTGKGDGPAAVHLVEVKPADFATDTLVASGSWDALYAKVREGGQRVHGSTMPPWGQILTDADMWDLVAYLATFQSAGLSKPTWAN